MMSQGEDVEIHALRQQGWSISAIARHVGRDRKTVRAYLAGSREVGVRLGGGDPFDAVAAYVRRRLVDDPHVRATVLYAEVRALRCGYARSYETFVRHVRVRGLRPVCVGCSHVSGRAHTDLDHPPGVELQWDWLELRSTPWGERAYVLVGVLSHSGRLRCWFSESMDQAHLVVAIGEVLGRLGGTARRWRVDRMATVVVPGTDRLQASFAPVAKHYGVAVDVCAPRRPRRKGVVEKAIDYLTQSWWRTARVGSPAQAQASADRWCVEVADARLRSGRGEPRSVAEAAAAEALLALPAAPYPVTVTVERTVSANALVSLWGNRYSVQPSFIDKGVQVTHRHGTDVIEIRAGGRIVATHRLAARGAHRTIRAPEHADALSNVVLAAFGSAEACGRKENRPPSEAALALAGDLHPAAGADPVIDLDVYRRVVEEPQGARS